MENSPDREKGGRGASETAWISESLSQRRRQKCQPGPDPKGWSRRREEGKECPASLPPLTGTGLGLQGTAERGPFSCSFSCVGRDGL